ncbi:MAG: F0F1 ATP synthase subunit gamma [Pontibacterium sp.]
MSHRRELEIHRQKLGEIREIMDAMKTMAYMETRKLSRFMDAQKDAVASIEYAARDFINHYPDVMPSYSSLFQVCLLVGSERGFCGDFNAAVLSCCEQGDFNPAEGMQIAVGRKLYSGLSDIWPEVLCIDGASVVEEVDNTLENIINTLARIQKSSELMSLLVFYHSGSELRVQKLLPPFEAFRSGTEKSGDAPLINMPANDLLPDLSEYYLFSSLYKILYLSLMAENHSRLAHLENAVEKLDEKLIRLAAQENRVRQEEIIEEIEIILLSADTLIHK